MRVYVDTAGHHIHAARVDPLVDRRRRQATRNILDLFILNKDVRLVGSFGGDNGPILNQSCAQEAPPVIWAQVRSGRPGSTRSIVMQLSTGQTSQHRLHPTHSSSSTRGMRRGGVTELFTAETFGVVVILARLA